MNNIVNASGESSEDVLARVAHLEKVNNQLRTEVSQLTECKNIFIWLFDYQGFIFIV